MKNDPLYQYLLKTNPDLVEDDKLRSHDTGVLTIPQSAPEGSIFRTENVMDLLERVKKFNIEWVKAGHVSGDNTNNVSATISIDPLEWGKVGDWIWKNRNSYNGLSVFPSDNGSYIQAPFENCTKEHYKNLLNKLNDIDLAKIVESDDNTSHSQELACAGGECSNE